MQCLLSTVTATSRAVSPENTKLSSSTTVARYLELRQADDRKALSAFIRERFEERYFKPIEDSRSKHGFASLAVACIVIETLESYYQGRADTRNVSAQMFRNFFKRDTPLKVFSSTDDWFFKNIRCGLLHQSEVRRGWRVLRSGPLLDTKARAINATRLLRELRKAVAAYGQELTVNEQCWHQFKKKMKAVCGNCK